MDILEVILLFVFCMWFIGYPLFKHFFFPDDWIYHGSTRYSPSRKKEQVSYHKPYVGEQWQDRIWERPCDVCHGRGCTYDMNKDQVPCNNCNGTGYILEDRQIHF